MPILFRKIKIFSGLWRSVANTPNPILLMTHIYQTFPKHSVQSSMHCHSLFIHYLYLVSYFIWLTEGETWERHGRDMETSTLLFDSSNAHNSQNCTNLKTGSKDSIQIPYMDTKIHEPLSTTQDVQWQKMWVRSRTDFLIWNLSIPRSVNQKKKCAHKLFFINFH